jgi:major membrane immunogen (membrane-anchored lipoprotein)
LNNGGVYTRRSDMRYIFIIMIMLVLLLSGCQNISSEGAIEIVLNDILKIAPEIANDVELHEIKEIDVEDGHIMKITLTYELL